MSDMINRNDALEIIQSMYPGIPRVPWLRKDWQERYEPYIRAEKAIRGLPSAQPDLTPDGTLNISVGVDVAKVGRILLSRTGTQEGGLYYKDAQPEPEELDFVQPHKTTGVKLEVAQPEIIRCRDCIHTHDHDCPVNWGRTEDDYCSWAER